MGPSLLAEDTRDTKDELSAGGRVTAGGGSGGFHRGHTNSRVDGLVFLPRLRPPGVDAGEDMLLEYLQVEMSPLTCFVLRQRKRKQRVCVLLFTWLLFSLDRCAEPLLG